MFFGSSPYQLAFVTPGIFPSSAIFRKQILHMPNFRRYPRGRPQILQRLCLRTPYFGVLFAFTTIAKRAKRALLCSKLFGFQSLLAV
jgi:hypothetical protein